jgi:hypothetical protein
MGKHMSVHNLDFEVFERDGSLLIFPHAENEMNIKTLPITNINLQGNDSSTKVNLKFSMRKIDSGGPMLIVVFCCFILIAGLIVYIVPSGDKIISYVMFGISLFIFSIFWMRMQSGYFDYVRKIKSHIKKQCEG